MPAWELGVTHRDRLKSQHQVWWIHYCCSLSLLPSLPVAFTQPGALTLANLCSMLPRLHQRSSLEFRTVIRTDLLKIIESLSHLRLSNLSNFRSVQPAVLYGNKLWFFMQLQLPDYGFMPIRREWWNEIEKQWIVRFRKIAPIDIINGDFVEFVDGSTKE